MCLFMLTSSFFQHSSKGRKISPSNNDRDMDGVIKPDAGKCELLSGKETYAIQLLLGVIAFGTLWYKRQVERPRRPLQIWSMDVSKQAIGVR
jgi:hypothetical protein